MKIVINKCYGGFGLSKEAEELYIQKKNISGSLRGDIRVSKRCALPHSSASNGRLLQRGERPSAL